MPYFDNNRAFPTYTSLPFVTAFIPYPANSVIFSDELRDIFCSSAYLTIVSNLAEKIGVTQAFGDLLPEGKVAHLEQLKANSENRVAFVGDGINDTPVLALSDVGIAMGGLGCDAAIETADVVIQTDQPSKVAEAIKIGKQTHRIVWQNISMAFGVKLLVLLLGAGGMATMWEAIFADVGVALLAIFNAMRIQKWKE